MRCQIRRCRELSALIVGDCKYCHRSFCLNHRLPEDHKCSKMEECQKESKEKNEKNLKWTPKPPNQNLYSNGDDGGVCV